MKHGAGLRACPCARVRVMGKPIDGFLPETVSAPGLPARTPDRIGAEHQRGSQYSQWLSVWLRLRSGYVAGGGEVSLNRITLEMSRVPVRGGGSE